MEAEWNYIVFQPCHEGNIPSDPKDYMEISISPFATEARTTGVTDSDMSVFDI